MSFEGVKPEVAAAAMAVCRGARSVRQVAAELGRSLDYTHRQLKEARDLGLVSWVDHRAGTLRPMVELVARS